METLYEFLVGVGMFFILCLVLLLAAIFAAAAHDGAANRRSDEASGKDKDPTNPHDTTGDNKP
jgi:hypothetical protein